MAQSHCIDHGFHIRGDRHHVKDSCLSDPSDRVEGDIPHIPPSAESHVPFGPNLYSSIRRNPRCNWRYSDIPLISLSKPITYHFALETYCLPFCSFVRFNAGKCRHSSQIKTHMHIFSNCICIACIYSRSARTSLPKLWILRSRIWSPPPVSTPDRSRRPLGAASPSVCARSPTTPCCIVK
eukprot:5406830-Pleurochrysis_carterae.AAC.2